MNTEHLLSKISTENTKYKRDLCKNWAKSGSCPYGFKCLFAHGYDELNEVDKLTEEQLKAHDIYKTVNCRDFYHEKFCQYGKRCLYRHEHRSFERIHRHFWMSQLSSIQYSFEDILTESKQS